MNHSPHIQQLIDEGYSVEIRENKFLLINRVPYLNKDLEARYGTIISELEMNGNDVKLNPQHPIYFNGEQPYKSNGKMLNPNKGKKDVVLLPNLKGDLYYSYKKNGQPYPNYYEKMKHYVHIFAKHAMKLDNSVTFDVGSLIEVPSNSPFVYPDCNSASPEANVLLGKFSDLKIGIIGVGGTGSYILDYISKTPVKEIHIFDGDYYHNKNAFRAPGATHIDSLTTPERKADYFAKEYSKIHGAVHSHPHYMKESNLSSLSGLSFVFISIDKSPVKKIIVEYLVAQGIDFIDVGMGVSLMNGAILGQIRTTTSTKGQRNHIIDNSRIKFTENDNNDYSDLVQIAELNALNAAFAVVKWKKLVGFYHDHEEEHHSIYQLHVNKNLNFDKKTRP